MASILLLQNQTTFDYGFQFCQIHTENLLDSRLYWISSYI